MSSDLLFIDLKTRYHLSEYLASLDGVIRESLLLAKQAARTACFKTLQHISCQTH